MTLTDGFVNYGAKLVRDRVSYLRFEYLNGPLAVKDFVSFLYNYSGQLNAEFYDKLDMNVPLCTVRIKGGSAVFISSNSVDEFFMSHPWDVGSRLERVLRGRLNTVCFRGSD